MDLNAQAMSSLVYVAKQQLACGFDAGECARSSETVKGSLGGKRR
jgi:hypothetical protein